MHRKQNWTKQTRYDMIQNYYCVFLKKQFAKLNSYKPNNDKENDHINCKEFAITSKRVFTENKQYHLRLE